MKEGGGEGGRRCTGDNYAHLLMHPPLTLTLTHTHTPPFLSTFAAGLGCVSCSPHPWTQGHTPADISCSAAVRLKGMMTPPQTPPPPCHPQHCRG